MRLEPVYLVAPKPAPPSVPTRRAFLIAGGTFLAGAALGGACGYAAGVGAAEEPDGQATPAPPSSGNAELDELRRLALKAPITDLLDRWLYFVDVYSSSYRNDEYLPTGVERLAKHVIANADTKQRVAMARSLAQVIELGERQLQEQTSHLLEGLRRIR